MEIPPNAPPLPPDFSGKPQPPLVAQLYTDWDTWWKQPTAETAGALINFLKNNENYFMKLGNSLPCPFPKPIDQHFADYYNDAINNLQNWVSHGCDPTKTTSVSEWVNDVYVWVDQTGKPPTNPLVAQLYTDWNDWSNQPTERTTITLINFLKNNESSFMHFGQTVHCPFPKSIDEDFADYFNNAINNLQAWVDDGCDPTKRTSVSNSINDIYSWVNQKSS